MLYIVIHSGGSMARQLHTLQTSLLGFGGAAGIIFWPLALAVMTWRSSGIAALRLFSKAIDGAWVTIVAAHCIEQSAVTQQVAAVRKNRDNGITGATFRGKQPSCAKFGPSNC